MGKKNGYAFMMVICVFTLMTALLMGILTLTMSAKKTTKNLEDTYRLSSMSESGVEKGLACLRQKIKNTPAIFSDKTTPLACDKFSFSDSEITCTIDISDYTDTSKSPNVPEVVIDSTAKNSKGKTKEDIVYINKNDISNAYYDMLFSNVITTLGKKDETDSSYKTAFSMGSNMGTGINEIALDGNMYLQGNTIDFRPKSNPVADQNNGYSYYLYTDTNGYTYREQFPYPDTIASTYISGKVKINCNNLNIPQDSAANNPIYDGRGTKAIFNTVTGSIKEHRTYVTDSLTLSPYDSARVGTYTATDWDMLDVLENRSGDSDLQNFSVSGYTIPQHYKIYFVPPLSTTGTLATFLIVNDGTPGTVFNFDEFIKYVKSYLEDPAHMPIFNYGDDYDTCEAKYSSLYKLFLIQGNVNLKPQYTNYGSTRNRYVNNLIYSTGKINVSTGYGSDAQNLSLNNCGLLGRSIVINQLKNVDVVPYSYSTINLEFERAVSLHGIKTITAGAGVYHLSPYSQRNRDSCNAFMLKHLKDYAKYFTFKIDKWVEK